MFNKEKIQKSKSYNQITKLILENKQPIVVFGPSGSGKTTTITHVLDILHRKYRFVELERTPIYRPVDNTVISIVYLYQQSDLELIKFRKNLIVETCIPWADKFEGFDSVKFNIPKNKKITKQETSNNMFQYRRNEQIGFFNMIGRIFYCKTHIREFDIQDDYLLYNSQIEKIRKKKNNKTKNTVHHLNSTEEQKSNKSNLEYTRYNIETKENKKQRKMKNFVISSSEEDEKAMEIHPEEQVFSLSFDEDLIFSTEESYSQNQENKTSTVCIQKIHKNQMNRKSDVSNEHSYDINNKILLAVTRLKKYIKTQPHKSFTTSFNIKKIEEFLYSNFVYFISIDQLPEAYECLSLSALGTCFFMCFIQLIIQRKNQNNWKFFSFHSSTKYNRTKLNKNWRYQELMNIKHM